MARTRNKNVIWLRVWGGRVTMKLSSLPALDAKKTRIRRNARNLKPVFTRFKRVVEDQIESSFRNERGAKRWKALSSAYRKWKQSHYAGKKKLILSGRYKKGFRVAAFNQRLRVLNRVKVGRHSLFDLHQHGTGRPRGKLIPARPVLFLTQKDKKRLAREIRGHVDG